MKNWVFILCVTMLLKPVLPVVEYIVNYNYVSTVLCVNKAKPAIACNGKCHLMKELAKASEQEKPLSQDKKHTTTEVTDLFFFQDNAFTLPAFYPAVKPALNCLYVSHSYSCTSGAVFRPPIFIA